MREYRALRALRNGETLDLDGIKLVQAEGDLEPGDLYVGQRNHGPVLLTVWRVHPEGWVIPTVPAYAYDLNECVKVKEAT